jgi:tetratricopeptide (TPR) repeat protein
MTSPDYAAFISYSHEDAKTAAWLQAAIERYVVPKRLVDRETRAGTIPRRLGKCFRDRDELPASPDLKAEVFAAIDRSRHLIVMCSPAAANSAWVDQEIEVFKQRHGADRIIAVITAGEPPDCFPGALRQGEPIAADLRPGKDGRRQVLLKVLAGMLGLGLDELVQREAQRRQRIYGIIAAGAAAASIAFAGLAGVAWQQRNIAIAATAKAAERRTQAEGLIEFMIQDLQEKMKSVGRLDMLDVVAQKALNYFAMLPPDEMDATAAGQKTRALEEIAELQLQRGQLSDALKTYQQAAESAKEALAKAPHDPDRLFEYGLAQRNLGFYFYTRSDLPKAEHYFSESAKSLEESVNIKSDNMRIRQLGISKKNLGVVYYNQMKFNHALSSFGDAENIFLRIVNSDPSNTSNISEYGDALAWKSDADRWIGATGEAAALRHKQFDLFSETLSRSPDDKEFAKLVVAAKKGLAILKMDAGDFAGAQAQLSEVEKEAQKLYEFDPSNKALLNRFVAASFDLATAEVMAGNLAAAAATLQVANANLDKLIRSVEGITKSIALVKTQSDLANAMFWSAKKDFAKTIVISRPYITALRDELGQQTPPRDDISSLSNKLQLALLGAQALAETGQPEQEAEADALIDERISPIPEPRSVLFEAIRAKILPALGRTAEAAHSLELVCKSGYRRIVGTASCDTAH